MQRASVPEPPPKPQGIVVPDALLDFLKHRLKYGVDDPLCALIRQRDAFGRAKYGQPLMSEDGRDGLEDARQEAGDLLQYAFKVYLSGSVEELSQIEDLVVAVYGVVTSMLAQKKEK